MTKQEYMAMSLPFGVYAKRAHLGTYKYNTLAYLNEFEVEEDNPARECCLPFLYPLSDLTKEIEHRGEKFVPIVELLKNSSFDTSKMSEEEIMSFVEVYSSIDLIALNDLPLYLQWHFDLFGGIESGEAIDVNTLKTNPYK